MFELETEIANWRKEIQSAGIQSPELLEELEGHLREGIDHRIRAGMPKQAAFEQAAQEIGGAGMLRSEFAKVGETLYERLKRLFQDLAGVPNYQLAMNMKSSLPNLEPRWATYVKTSAFIIPAIFIWMGYCVYVLPKLKEICVASGMELWRPITATLYLTDLVRQNFIMATMLVTAILILLEWRSASWPRYRRLVLGVTAFTLNLIALAIMATLAVLAVAAGAHLLPQR